MQVAEESFRRVSGGGMAYPQEGARKRDPLSSFALDGQVHKHIHTETL